MRLIIKTTLLYLLLVLIVFGIGGVFIYKSVQKEVAKETDYSLKYHLSLVIDGLKSGKPLEDFVNHKVFIQKLDGNAAIRQQPVFSDTMAMHPQLDRMEQHRKLSVDKLINDETYRIEIIDVIIEENDVLEGVINTLIRLFLVLGIVFIAFGFLISRQVLKPFQQTLEKIAAFNLNSEADLDFPKTSTTEFKNLNHFLTKMTNKAKKDYKSLKEFSENASHEMQTPIAIAKGKLEILLESEELKPDQFKLIDSAQDSLKKLSKLGKSLSLLTKIENKEFSNIGAIDFSAVVNQCVSKFEEFIDLKKLHLNSKIQNAVSIVVDPVLADILVVNLLKNAIQHNVEGGWINIELDRQQLSVKNSGLAPKIPSAELFKRFRKSNQTSNSLGLGLAIVQKICEVSGFEINYSFENETHELLVSFQQ